jgi:hypothetical protein
MATYELVKVRELWVKVRAGSSHGQSPQDYLSPLLIEHGPHMHVPDVWMIHVVIHQRTVMRSKEGKGQCMRRKLVKNRSCNSHAILTEQTSEGRIGGQTGTLQR